MKLKIGSGGREIEVGEAEVTIGREDCDVTIEDDDELSRRHAAVKALPDGGAEVSDLGSRNGTFVDGDRVEGSRQIEGGETIRVGQTEIATEAVPPAAGATKISGSPGPAPTVAGPPPPPPPSPGAPSSDRRPPPNFGAPGGPPPPPGKRSKGPPLWLWLVLGGVVLVAVAVAAWFLLIRESAEDQIDEAVNQVFVVADADACDYFTANFYEEAAEVNDQTVEEAEQACRDAEDVVPSDSATVTDLEVDGDTATGTVDFTAEGEEQSVDVSFADEDGWKIDSIEFPE